MFQIFRRVFVTDQRYVAVFYIMLCYVRVENRHKSVLLSIWNSLLYMLLV